MLGRSAKCANYFSPMRFLAPYVGGEHGPPGLSLTHMTHVWQRTQGSSNQARWARLEAGYQLGTGVIYDAGVTWVWGIVHWHRRHGGHRRHRWHRRHNDAGQASLDCEAQSHSTRRDEIVSLWLPGGISRYLAARLLSSPSSDPALLRRSKHATRSSQMGADPEGTMCAGWCVFDDYTKDRQCDFMDLVSPKPISCIECALVHSHLLASGT